MTSPNLKTEEFFKSYLSLFLSENNAARLLCDDLQNCGVGIMPLIDHCTLRTLDVDNRVKELVSLGFVQDQSLGILEFDNW